MRVCDRHPRTPAVTSMVLEKTDGRYDLCQDCLELIETFLATKDQGNKVVLLKKDSAKAG